MGAAAPRVVDETITVAARAQTEVQARPYSRQVGIERFGPSGHAEARTTNECGLAARVSSYCEVVGCGRYSARSPQAYGEPHLLLAGLAVRETELAPYYHNQRSE
jgi:hypothetical protein